MHFDIYIYIYIFFEEVHFDILKISLVASLYICNHLTGNINFFKNHETKNKCKRVMGL